MAEEQKGTAAEYLDMLKEAERADSKYHSVCDKIDKLYADLEMLSGSRTDREYQIFWANLEVLKPTIYSRAPIPVVTSRFRDRKPLPRRAADLLERALTSDFEADDVHDTMKDARDDVARSARGVVWMRIGDRDGLDVPMAEHLDRKDFRHGPARKWREVPWTARRGWLTRAEFTERFKTVPPGVNFEEQKIDGQKGAKKAGVWEVWDREADKVVWVSEGAKDILDEKDPWMRLTGFYPCPRPAYGTLKPGTLTPVPDFVYYKDQIEEINELTARVSSLAESLRLKGFYPAGAGDVGEALKAALDDMDNRATLVPVASLAALGNGSLKDAIIWLPVKDVAEVIVQCLALRRQLIEDVYEITGISDIMRGSTDANETLGAQELKSQYGSIRVRGRQDELVRLARDITRMKCEIMAENVSIADLMAMAQVEDLPSAADIEKKAQPIKAQLQQIAQQAEAAMQPLLMQPDQQAAAQQAQQIQQAAMQQAQPLQQQLQELQGTITQEQVGQLLKDQKIRPFVLDIETDSTIQPDENAEKQKRTELMQALAPLLSQGVTAMQQAPQLAPFIAETIRYVAGAFRAGRQMDDAIDELAEGFKNYQPTPPPQAAGEDPEAAKITAEAAMTKAQADAKKSETDSANAISEMQIRQQESVGKQKETDAKIEKLQAETRKIQAEIQAGAVKTQVEVQAKVAENDRADRQMVTTEQHAEREFERSTEQQSAAEARASQESAAKVKAMNKPKGPVA